MPGKHGGWPGEPKRHGLASKGVKTVTPMHGAVRKPYKEALTADLHRDGFGPKKVIYRRLEMQEKVLKRLWDGATGHAFALALVYRAGMGKDHDAKKRIADTNWNDLSGDAKKLLLQEYAYGEDAWTGI